MVDNDVRPDRQQRRIAGLIHEQKLSWDQVNEIRGTYVPHSRTCGLKSLAVRYGVSVNNVHKIVRGKTWKITEGDGNVAPPLAGRITAQQFSKVLSRYGQKLTLLREKLDRLSRY